MGAYEFQGESVRIMTVTPGLGPVPGGTAVTITGLNFVDEPEVWFGGVQADPSFVTWVSDTELTAVTPAQVSHGPVDVRVVNPDGGEDTLASGFTYSGGPGDLNGDGTVDSLDLVIILANVGLDSVHPSWDPRCDPDSNGACNLDDLMAVFRNWGSVY